MYILRRRIEIDLDIFCIDSDIYLLCVERLAVILTITQCETNLWWDTQVRCLFEGII